MCVLIIKHIIRRKVNKKTAYKKAGAQPRALKKY